MIIIGKALEQLRKMPDGIASCGVTSPPYYKLRDYGVDGQIGLEETPEEFIEKLVSIFHEFRRVLRDDGTLWVNIADTYAGKGYRGGGDPTIGKRNLGNENAYPPKTNPKGCKPGDLIGIPWMLAFAMRADGWYLRQEIIWSKPNPMPESVRNRCTKSHESLFLFSKCRKYYYDAAAISEPVTETTVKRLSQDIDAQAGSITPSKGNGKMKAATPRNAVINYYLVAGSEGALGTPQSRRRMKVPSGWETGSGSHGTFHSEGRKSKAEYTEMNFPLKRNKRDVWVLATTPFPGSHFATFPKKLVEPCILAGSPKGGLVVDMFAGSGTTGVVALSHERQFIGIELKPEYAEIAEQRIRNKTDWQLKLNFTEVTCSSEEIPG